MNGDSAVTEVSVSFSESYRKPWSGDDPLELCRLGDRGTGLCTFTLTSFWIGTVVGRRQNLG